MKTRNTSRAAYQTFGLMCRACNELKLLACKLQNLWLKFEMYIGIKHTPRNILWKLLCYLPKELPLRLPSCLLSRLTWQTKIICNLPTFNLYDDHMIRVDHVIIYLVIEKLYRKSDVGFETPNIFKNNK